jgi:hypothetical protein
MTCPICNSSSQIEWRGIDQQCVNCPRCGAFVLLGMRGTFDRPLTRILSSNRQRARLSYLIRRRGAGSSAINLIELRDIEGWNLDEPLPSPAEQLDMLISWIGDNQPSPADSTPFNAVQLEGWLGTAIGPSSGNGGGLGWLLVQDEAKHLLDQSRTGMGHLRLNLRGWQRYEALKRAKVESSLAFMAMQYGDEELERVVKDYFAPAVKRAGFELRTLRDGQPAGLIDDQLRVALRRSRFVIADLTHANRGAYWEAGFAEGLGRPVIYTCSEVIWKGENTHFDTNHLTTIIWDSNNLSDAADRLTASIRASLPGEAKLED